MKSFFAQIITFTILLLVINAAIDLLFEGTWNTMQAAPFRTFAMALVGGIIVAALQRYMLKKYPSKEE